MIDRRGIIPRTGMGAVALRTGGLFWKCSGTTPAPEKPNIIFIMADNVGYGDAGGELARVQQGNYR